MMLEAAQTAERMGSAEAGARIVMPPEEAAEAAEVVKRSAAPGAFGCEVS
jgi:hypothetical protein